VSSTIKTRIRDALRVPISAAARMAVRLFERRIGVHSWGDVYAYGGSQPHLYRGSSWLVLRELFANLEVAEDDVFVDMGSGMGRVLFMAARRPFRRVIGVEVDEELNEIAQQNIERNRHRLQCQNVEIVTADVFDWEIPEDVTVVYIFRPFRSQVFERVLDRLLDSIDRSPRKVRFVYNYCPVPDHRYIMSTGRATRVSIRVPRYLRARYRELSVFLLHPRSRAESTGDPDETPRADPALQVEK
jgi:predicted RNA methylase